ncbi:MAG: type II toxin-antitoxin system HicB family antitoxin [Chloroflexi bacterium]|nr:type II toxin-antitoxin system HicB family antitoxin [Chloroflexota bacterium]MCY4246869.1 type II toxin-antitoxin system HicB family antitoxin [Chloroflexota bacterium]
MKIERIWKEGIMNACRLEKAQTLARQNYRSLVFPDKTTDGDAIYVAVLLDIPGCNSFGYTVQEALENLESAKVDFIYFLLEDGLPVPEPQMLQNSQVIKLGDYIENVVDQAAQQASKIVQIDFIKGNLYERQLAQG